MVRAGAWSFAATNDTSQKELLSGEAGLVSEALARSRKLVDDKLLLNGIESLVGNAKGFLATTEEVIKAEELKSNIVKTQTMPSSRQAVELMQKALALAQRSAADTRAQAALEMREAGSVNLGFGLAVVLMLFGAAGFSFLGVARPMTH
jgi:hypothetical protein